MVATTATLQEISEIVLTLNKSQYAVKAHQRHAGLYIRIECVQCGRRDEEVQLYAFDILALDSCAPRRCRCAIDPDLFKAACNMGLEGMVSKRADRAYRAGRCTHWVKVKNRKHPAYRRAGSAPKPALSHGPHQR